MLCLLRSRHNNGQPFIAIVDRAEQCPAATTVIEIHQSEVELAAALPNGGSFMPFINFRSD